MANNEQTRGNSEEVGHVGNASRGLPPDGSHPIHLQLSEELQKVDGELKTTEAVLESKILEIKKINEEKKAALAAQFAEEVTLRRVHAAQKDDDMPPIEAIIAQLEAELKLARQEIAKLQDDNRALDRLIKSKEDALLEAEKKASLVDDLLNENQELTKQICLNEGSAPASPKPKPQYSKPLPRCRIIEQGRAPAPLNRARFLLVEEDGITERSRTLAMANNEHSYGGGRRLAISPITCTSPPRPSPAPRPPPPEDGITERVQPASSPSKNSECVKPLSYVFFNEPTLSILSFYLKVDFVSLLYLWLNFFLPFLSFYSILFQLDQGINKSQLDNDPPNSYNQPPKPPKEKKGSWFS